MNSKAEWSIIENMMAGDFNPNHDPENGQFTSGSGGSGTRVFSSGDVVKEFSKEGDNYYVKTELKSAKMGSKPELYSKELWEEELEEAKSSWTEEKSSVQTRGVEIKGFNEALHNANIRHAIETQKKDKVKKAKKAYMDDLVKQGVDKETAKTMAKVFFEYGIVKPL